VPNAASLKTNIYPLPIYRTPELHVHSSVTNVMWYGTVKWNSYTTGRGRTVGTSVCGLCHMKNCWILFVSTLELLDSYGLCEILGHIHWSFSRKELGYLNFQ